LLFQGLVERAQKLFGIKAFFFEEMDQSLPTIEDGTAGFLEILDSVVSKSTKLNVIADDL